MSADLSQWRRELRACLTDPRTLPLSAQHRRRLSKVTARYPMRIPPHLARLIRWDDARCPIRRQLLPDQRELRPGGVPDPLDEESYQLAPGVIRRFADRLLALVSTRCPVLCRHCNRKRHWTRPPAPADAQDIASALSRARTVREVILSGGEPLLLRDTDLEQLLQAARSRPGVELVRVHSRAPVSLPSRVTPALVRRLARHQPLWLVTHFNHAAELTPESRAALARLRAAGIPLLNQAVLLRGVNDSVRAQARLGRALVHSGVKPYYLFQLDRATGSLHFQVSIEKSLQILEGLRSGHSGLLVPQLMVDLPGKGGKVPIAPGALLRSSAQGVWLRGADGRARLYAATSEDGG